MNEVVADCPKQDNEADCRIFAYKIAEVLARDATPRFSQQDMQFYRKLMIYEISKKCLITDRPRIFEM